MTATKAAEAIDVSLMSRIHERHAKRAEEIEEAVKQVNLGYEFCWAIDATRSCSGYPEIHPSVCPKEYIRALTAARDEVRRRMTYQSRPA